MAIQRPNKGEDLIALDQNGNLDIAGTVNNFSNQAYYVPAWDEIAEEYYGYLHPIIKDKRLRPLDKPCADGQIDRSARIVYESEKATCREFVQMGFTNPVIRTYDTADENGNPDPVKEAQAKAIETIYQEQRIDGINSLRVYAWLASCEFATIQYSYYTGKVHTRYGFPTPFEIRSRSYSPMPQKDSGITEADIYAIFDKYDSLIGLAIKYDYTVKDNINKASTTQYFEAYFADRSYFWFNDGDGWREEEQGGVNGNPIGKIPGVYARRSSPIWNGTTTFRHELEMALSREADSLRKNSRPIIVLSGTTLGDGPTDNNATREFYQVENGGDIKLIAPALTYEASRSYTDELKQDIRAVTQMPDMTAKGLYGVGAVSGTSKEMLLVNSELRVKQESQELLVAFDRECNVIKAYLGELNVAWRDSIQNLKVTHELDIYRFNDRSQRIIDMANAKAAGIASEYTCIKELDLVADVEEEMKRIQSDREAEVNSINVADRLI